MYSPKHTPCLVCDKENPSSLQTKVCSDCISKDLDYCNGCRQVFHTGEIEQGYCLDCSDELFTECTDCGDLFK